MFCLGNHLCSYLLAKTVTCFGCVYVLMSALVLAARLELVSFCRAILDGSLCNNDFLLCLDEVKCIRDAAKSGQICILSLLSLFTLYNFQCSPI